MNTAADPKYISQTDAQLALIAQLQANPGAIAAALALDPGLIDRIPLLQPQITDLIARLQARIPKVSHRPSKQASEGFERAIIAARYASIVAASGKRGKSGMNDAVIFEKIAAELSQPPFTAVIKQPVTVSRVTRLHAANRRDSRKKPPL